MNGWKDISTAPTDGTRFDGWDGSSRIPMCYCNDGRWWSWQGGHGALSLTHWRDIPKAPSENVEYRSPLGVLFWSDAAADPLKAIEWALDGVGDGWHTRDFLAAWREGDVHEWPEYLEWTKMGGLRG